MFKAPVGTVVPGCVQFKAQHRRAADTCGPLAGPCAVAQQSAMPAIGQLCSPSPPWTPAIAPPVMAAMIMKAVNHFRVIASTNILYARCQASSKLNALKNRIRAGAAASYSGTLFPLIKLLSDSSVGDRFLRATLTHDLPIIRSPS